MGTATRDDVLEALRRLTRQGQADIFSTDIANANATQGSLATVRRHLEALRAGNKRASRLAAKIPLML